VPKQRFDACAFPEFREEYAKNHYVFAVKSLFGLLEKWRTKYCVAVPMQYVFDHGSLGEQQLGGIWDKYSRDERARTRYGIADDGVLFQSKTLFKPLQAADILAWQMHNHMRKVISRGCQPHEEYTLSHPGFRLLRDHQVLDLAFYSTQQLQGFFSKTTEHHKITGRWPWEGEGPIGGTVRLTEPGRI
jgi:hypothetical protein